MALFSRRHLMMAALIAACSPLSAWAGSALDQARFPDVNGKLQSVENWRGKVVVVNFWATTCVTCKKEMPKMIEMFNQYHPKGVEYVAVAMQYDEPEIVKNYASANKLPFQLVWDKDGAFANTFGDIIGTPTTYIINKKGQTKKYIGEPDWPQFYADLDRALAS